MIRYGPALLSVLLSLGAVAGYYAFLRVPAIRNHPELYLVAFALGTFIAAAASWRAPRWPNLVALALSAVLLVLGGYFNFVLAKIPATATALRVGEASTGGRRSSWSSIEVTGDRSASLSSKDLEPS